MKFSCFIFVVAALGLGVGLSGCQIEESFGYVPTKAEIDTLIPNQDNKASIRAKFGPPSTIGESDAVWYYVASRRQNLGPFPSREVERRILELSFSGDRLAGIQEYGQEIAQDVPLSRFTTETGGRELTLWQQLRGNIGNFSAESFLQDL